jgi:gliding motility-associated-like protein
MKFLKIFLPLYFVLFSTELNAQNFVMDGTPVNSCSGTFFDPGGANGDYAPNQIIATTICPDFTSGTHISLSFNPPSIEGNDNLCFYDGVDINATLLTCSSDFNGGAFVVQATAVNPSGCLTVEFTSDATGQESGWAAVISCAPACQQITAILDSTDPIVVPVDTGYIDICKGNTIDFSGSGLYPQDGIVYNHSDLTSTFEWNFGDGTTALGPNVVHTFDDAGGYVVQLTITDQFGCTNTNFLNQRVRVSSEPEIELGNYEEQICINDTLELNAVVNNTNSNSTISINPVDLGFQTGATLSDSLALPDGNGTSYSTSVNFNNFGPGQVLTDVNDIVDISMNIEHSWMGDLQITLTAPNGVEVILHDFNGGLGEVFLGEPNGSDSDLVFGLGYDYTWSEAGIDTWSEFAIATGVPTLPAGNYATFEPLSDLLGTPLNGEWTITVTDNLTQDNGFIFNWGINFAQELFPLIETFTPQLINYNWIDQSIITYLDQDSIAAVPTNAGIGNFIFEVEDEFGCLWESNVNIEFLPETHPDCFECSEILNEFPDTTICVGDTLTIDAGGANLDFDVPFISFNDYELGFANHPPSDPYNAVININSINNTNIVDPSSDINSVCIDFETNFLSDVSFYLEAPNGAIIELTSGNGGSSDFYTNTCFTPTATTLITAGTTPFTGDYQIEGNWVDLIGSPINGDWTLLVTDNSGVSSFGNLNWWSISFASGINTDITWSPADNIDCIDCPIVQYIAADNIDQELIINATNSLGCLDTDTIQLSIEPPVEAPVVSCNNDVAGTVIFSWPQIEDYDDYLININNAGFIPANGILSHSVTGLNNGDLLTAIIMVQATGEECNILETTIDCYNCTMTSGLLSTLPTSCFDSCDGQAVLEVNGGDLPYSFSYLDSDGNTIITNTPNLSDLCAGPNVLSVIDGANCIESYNTDISAPDEILVKDSLLVDVSCFGLSDGSLELTIDGGIGSIDEDLYDSDNNLVNSTILEAGNYTMVLTDNNGCTDTSFYQIQQPEEIQISLLESAAVLCSGSSDGSATMEIIGGTYPYSYFWTGNSLTDSINTALSPGLNTFVVEDDNGCIESLDVLIGEPANLEISLIQTEQACSGIAANIATATVTGGNWPYSFIWSDNSTDSIATTLASGINGLTVTDNTGCPIEGSIFIEDLEPITFGLSPQNPDCFNGNNGTVEVISVIGGNLTMNYSFIFDDSTPVPENIVSGLSADQGITIQVIDEQGCLSEVTEVQLSNPPELQLNTNIQDVSCGGLSDGSINVISVSFAQAPLEYNWDLLGPNSNQTDLTSGDYELTVTDNLGCIVTETLTVNEPEPVIADFDLTYPPCNGKNTGAIDLTNTGGAGNYSYIWSNDSLSQDLQNIFSGTYQVTVTDGNDCVFEFEIDLPQPTPINPGLTVEDLNCFGINDGSITFNTTGATPPYLYMINEDDYFGNPLLTGLAPGNFNLEIIDDNGCTFDTIVSINEPEELMLLFPNGSNLELNLEDEVYLNQDYIEIINNQGAYNVEWFAAFDGTLSCTDCENPVAFPYNTISYEVQVIDDNGCMDTEILIINVNKYRVVLVPRGFTPNDDDNNDQLLTHGKDGTIVDLFQVFDRWGTLVYERSGFEINDNLGWDGTMDGKEMPTGAYLWNAEVTYIDGLSERHEGQVNLIR